MAHGPEQLDPSRHQLRWVVLLLVVAVALATGCLLWFMGQAVHNARSAASQRQEQAARETLRDLRAETNRLWTTLADWRTETDALAPLDLFRLVVEGRDVAAPGRPLSVRGLAGALLYRVEGDLLFPPLDAGIPTVAENEPQMLSLAWRLEYTRHDYGAAAREYINASRSSTEPAVHLRALLGAIRCRIQAGQHDEAIALAQQCLAEAPRADSADLTQQLTQLRVRLVEQLAERPEAQREQLRALLIRLTAYPREQQALSPEARRYFLERALDLADRYGQAEHAPLVARTRQRLQIETRVARLSERYPQLAALGHWPDFQLRRIDPNEGLYGFQVGGTHRVLLVMWQREALTHTLAVWLDRTLPPGLPYRLVEDGVSRLERHLDAAAVPLLSMAFCDYLPAWSLEVFKPAGDVLDSIAQRQTSAYLWTGSIVIVSLLVLGAVLAVALGRQVRLHRLKNDFIATVSHELKTPLASMRLLVDTLLAGRTRRPEQAQEYLRLLNRENVRLTGLIDNFLTFSRMERNRQAFRFEATAPARIAQEAVAALETRLQAHDVAFTLDLPEALPPVCVDCDAVVTVLANLLDNAIKYSGPEIRIRLRVRAERGRVVFAVQDNGWGIPRRAQRRIFGKFYQVDRSLARRRDGCGLGLSIVRFIVEAHPGARIVLDSRPDHGSTFTVSFPADPHSEDD